MKKFKTVNDPYHIYFATAKIEGGKHIFKNKKMAEIILNSLSFLVKQKRILLFAFVIMPNHVHFLFKPLKEWTAKKNSNDFLSFTAHAIVKELKCLGEDPPATAVALQAGASTERSALGKNLALASERTPLASERSPLASSPKVYKNLLNFFKYSAKSLDDRKYKIWQDILVKNCYSEKFVRQKLSYIHNNPINKGWNLVKNRSNYLYSSACYYDSDMKIKPIIEVAYLWNYFFGVDGWDKEL